MKIQLTDSELKTAIFEYLQRRNQRTLIITSCVIHAKVGAVVVCVHEKLS
jgi:hypothetical protein